MCISLKLKILKNYKKTIFKTSIFKTLKTIFKTHTHFFYESSTRKNLSLLKNWCQSMRIMLAICLNIF